MFDKDSGKPKGYGFCEFFDRHCAESAVRNLAGHEIGGRSLRVDFAEETRDAPGAGGTGQPQIGDDEIEIGELVLLYRILYCAGLADPADAGHR